MPTLVRVRLNRDAESNWISRLPARVVIGSAAMTTVLLVWTFVLMTLFIVGAMADPVRP